MWLIHSPVSVSNDAVAEVEKMMEGASWILLENSWEEEGVGEYEQGTMDRVRDFLVSVVREARHHSNRDFPVPAINPADAGSIDIFWNLDGRQLLVNVSADPTDATTFYGEDRFGTVVSGVRSSPDKVVGAIGQGYSDYLVAWLLISG